MSKIERRQLTRWEKEHLEPHYVVNFQVYFEQECVKTAISVEVCSYGYRTVDDSDPKLTRLGPWLPLAQVDARKAVVGA